MIGEREVLPEHTTESRSGGVFAMQRQSVSHPLQPAIEAAVPVSEIEQLPDLEGI